MSTMDANPLKKKRKRNLAIDDAGQEMYDKERSARGSELDEGIGGVASSVPDPQISSSKKTKRRKEDSQRKSPDADNGHSEHGNGIIRDECELKGVIDSSSSEKKKRRKEDSRRKSPDADNGQSDHGNGISRDESELKGSELEGVTDSSSPEKKKRRKEDSQPKSPNVDNGQSDHGSGISRDESELKGVMDSTQVVVFEPLVPLNSKEPRKKKKVRFQEPGEDALQENITPVPRESKFEHDVDLAYLSQGRNWKKDIVRPGLVYGKYTKDEDEKIKTAVFSYIKSQGWDANEGLQTILRSGQHGVARGCWLEIAKCLPYRPVKQINARAHRTLGGEKRGKWSADEREMLKDLHNVYGRDWQKIAVLMDRSAQLCKDKWRKLRLKPFLKSGRWTQDEYDRLCKLVRRSLRVKASIPAKALDRRHLRDDINWEWIAEEMQRPGNTCADIWYEKLASPLIGNKKWANGDDHLLLQSLMTLGPASEEAVDWDSVLDHRDGEICLERWMQMKRLLGLSNNASFEDKLEVLAKRYSPELLGMEEEA